MKWDFLNTGFRPGTFNMELDRSLADRLLRRDGNPMLRVYGWDPHAVSIGYNQSMDDFDARKLREAGIDIVRRPTGGRAILHTDELTYSVAGPQNEPRFAGSVLESYQALSQALLFALNTLGIPAQALEKPGQAVSPGVEPALDGSTSAQAEKAPQNPVCFEVPSNYEITVGGKKLIGSAQARRKAGVLQHGSLPLTGDLTRVVQALDFPDPAARERAAQRLLSRAATVEQVLGRPLSWEEAAQAFIAGFESALSLKLELAEPSAAEKARAAQLLRDKYTNPEWTDRV